MQMSRIFGDEQMSGAVSIDSRAADIRMAHHLAQAALGDAGAYFDLGVVFSTASEGVAGDLVEAHKWFNLAAVAGHDCAKSCRADIAEEMSPREIAEAQRRAREWIAATGRRAA